MIILREINLVIILYHVLFLLNEHNLINSLVEYGFQSGEYVLFISWKRLYLDPPTAFLSLSTFSDTGAIDGVSGTTLLPP